MLRARRDAGADHAGPRPATGLAALVRGCERVVDPLSPHLRFFTRRSLRALLGELGFDVGELERRRGTLLAIATR